MTKIIILLTALICCFINTNLDAQNLVPNPSFETEKDTSTSTFIPTDWFNLTTTTDFFHRINYQNSPLDSQISSSLKYYRLIA